MNLPASVVAAKEKAEAIQKQLNEPAPKPEGTPADQAAPVAPKETDQKRSDTPDYKDRYQTLKGKYDAEVPRLQSEVRNLQEQMLTLRQENEALKKAETEKPKDPPQEPVNLDYDALDEYGPEFRKLGETLQAVVQRNEQLEAELRKLNGNVESVQQASVKEAHEKFLDKVRTEVSGLGGNFETLNTDPAFLTWLHQVPPGSQFQRIALLHDAERRHDVVQCRAIFKEYIDALPDDKQKQPPNMQPPPSPPPETPGEPSGKQWTRKDIKQFYADKAAGKYTGREDQAKAIEADIFAAPAQGRVVG
jgi:cell division protein FtsB